MESFYIKILGVSLVLSVSCGAKILHSDTDITGYSLNKGKNSQVIAVSTERQYEIRDLESNLDYIIYIIELQCKNGVELNHIFNYKITASADQTISIDFQPVQGVLNCCDNAGYRNKTSRERIPDSQNSSSYAVFIDKNPVRAGPTAA